MSADVDEPLCELRGDYPGWTFEYLPGADLPWQAGREPSALPDGGGYGWIPAETPERLRELVGAAHQIEAQLLAEEETRRGLAGLRARLAAAGFETEQDLSGLTAMAPPVNDGPRRTVKIACKPRPEDRNRLWFWLEDGKPIAEADHIPDTVVYVTGHLQPLAPATLP